VHKGFDAFTQAKSMPKRSKMKKIIATTAAPAAVGPYSQAVEAGSTLYVSGQLPIDPTTKTMPEGIEAQTEQSLRNIEAILHAAGYSKTDVVKSTVLLQNISDFAAMNAVYAKFYTENPPARVAFEVAALPMGALVEIETIAVKD
jgi:2-iminobutanoate/2-iminopropanoate deaminase